MRIAHISDLHLDANNRQVNLLNAERLFEHISLERFDHVIVSGDITENADDSAFEIARKLFKKYGLLDPARLSVTIGNHDIYGGVYLAEDVVNFPARCRAADFNEKVNKFCHYFRETFENTSRPADNRFFPFIKVLDEVVLVGLNSVAEYSALKNPFASNGRISSEQLSVMNQLLLGTDISDKRIIAVTHHHFCKDSLDMTSSSGTIWQSIEKQTMKLRNRKRIIKKLKKAGVGLVLHGHLHESSSYIRKDLKFLNAGGSILGNKKGLSKLNEIVVNKSGLFHNISAIESEIIPAAHYNEFKNFIYTLPDSTPQRSVICMN